MTGAKRSRAGAVGKARIAREPTRGEAFCLSAITACFVALVGAVSSSAAAAPQETVLHSFAGYPNDGGAPTAGLIADSAGNLYGTTLGGGAFGYGYGTVFKLTPAGTETVLHSFAGYPNDGESPSGSLIADSAGLPVDREPPAREDRTPRTLAGQAAQRARSRQASCGD